VVFMKQGKRFGLSAEQKSDVWRRWKSGQTYDRPEGIRVNGVVTSYDMHFPITYSFGDYDCSSLLVPLHAGKNTIEIFNVSNHGIARADTMTVTLPGTQSCHDTAP
jgi:hypothetical protein